MRKILLSEESLLFNRELHPEDVKYYKNNKEKFQEMFNDQPLSFWLKFVITFRSVMYKHGLVPWKDERRIYCEECFISIHDIMSIKTAKERGQKVQEILDAVETAYVYNGLGSLYNFPPERLWASPMKVDLEKLFGAVLDIPKKYCVFYIWTRFAAALVEIYKRWLKATVITASEDFQWKSPFQWRNMSKINRVHLFERHLKLKWGKKLGKLLHVSLQSIVWWNQLQKLDLLKCAEQLPKCSVRMPFMPVDVPTYYPWDDDDESDSETEFEDQDDSSEDEFFPFIPPAFFGPGQGFYRVGSPVFASLEDIAIGMLCESLTSAFLSESFSTRHREDNNGRAKAPRPGQSLRACRHCDIVEPYFGMYKCCKRCVDLKLPDKKVYCGRSCQVADWRLQHCQEHRDIKKTFKRF